VYSGAASPAEMHNLFGQIWNITDMNEIGPWFE
jgi:hypothetical protein